MAADRKLYDTLEINPDANESEIKKAYRHMALRFHPDKNNHSKESTAKFQEITQAYQVLSDAEQRRIYDAYGLDGLSGKPVANPPPRFTHNSNLFTELFGDTFSESFRVFSTFGHSERPQQGRQTKGPDISHKLSCTLEELYSGKTSRLAYNRTELCDACNAKGGIRIHKCSLCKGTGRIVIRTQFGPMMQRIENTCNGCSGAGEVIYQNDICQKCHGAKTVMERRIFSVDVQPGSKDGSTVILDGEGDQGPGIIPGNVVVTIVQKPHNAFKRSGNNLIYSAKIDLPTALTGGSFTLKHLNGKYLNVEIFKGEIIRPKLLKTVKGYGMPINRHVFGDLIIQFSVTFPSYLSEESIDLLIQALPRAEKPYRIPADATQVPVFLSEYSPNDPQQPNLKDNNTFDDSQNQRPTKRRREGNVTDNFSGERAHCS